MSQKRRNPDPYGNNVLGIAIIIGGFTLFGFFTIVLPHLALVMILPMAVWLLVIGGRMNSAQHDRDRAETLAEEAEEERREEEESARDQAEERQEEEALIREDLEQQIAELQAEVAVLKGELPRDRPPSTSSTTRRRNSGG
jgi:uncharacterized membrane protein